MKDFQLFVAQGGIEGKMTRQGGRSRKGKGGRVTLDPAAQAYIGKQLQGLYDDVIRQEIPTRFLSLLERIDNALSNETGPANFPLPEKK